MKHIRTLARILFRVFSWVALAVLLNYLLGRAVRSVMDTPINEDDYHTVPALAGSLDWYPQYQKEFYGNGYLNQNRYRPFVVWKRRDQVGQYINIKNGIRDTYVPAIVASNPAAAVNVYFMGASNTWGWGHRDTHTIPSEFARLAEAANVPVHAVNYADIAWNSSQEVLQLAELCSLGKIPDVAVFYEGPSDMFAWLPPSVEPNSNPDEPGHIQLPLFRHKVEHDPSLGEVYSQRSLFHILVYLAAKHPDPKALNPRLDEKAETVAGERAAIWHRANMDLARHLAEAYHFRLLVFWEPWVQTKTKNAGEDGQRFPLTEQWAVTHRVLSARRDPSVIDITDALNDSTQPVMIDPFHTNEAGALLVAKSMYRHAEPVLHEVLRAKVGAPTEPKKN